MVQRTMTLIARVARCLFPEKKLGNILQTFPQTEEEKNITIYPCGRDGSAAAMCVTRTALS